MRTSRLLALLGGDHPALALAELIAVLETGGYRPTQPEVCGRVVTVDIEGDLPPRAIGRLGLTRIVCQFWGEHGPLDGPGPTPEQLGALVATSGQMPQGSYRVRATRTGEAQSDLPLTRYESEVGGCLFDPANPACPVDLRRPDHTLRILAGRRLSWGLELGPTAYRKAEKHHVRHRPHFAPVSLHPRLARAMVNLARLPEGGTVVDPFCGTGGVLIEAGLMGHRCFGSDLLEEMVTGSRTNLDHFGVVDDRVRLERAEVGDLPQLVGSQRPPSGQMAIVTDPPYGRSTTTDREPVARLMERAWTAFAKVLLPGERVVLALPSTSLWEPALESGDFELESEFQQRVHRSLTRHFGVLERR